MQILLVPGPTERILGWGGGGGRVYVPPNRVWFLRDLIHK